MDILNRIAMFAGGLPGFSEMYGGWCADVVGTTATSIEATKAATTDKSHVIVGFDISVYDATIAADSYIKVELIEDTGGTPVTLATYWYDWDIDEVGQGLCPHVYNLLPIPIRASSGMTVSVKLTVAAAPDNTAANLYGITR